MDYGDGLIAGVYQFNERYRRNDICSTLSATMAGQGSVQNCWQGRSPPVGQVDYEWVKRVGTGTDITDAEGAALSECLPLKASTRAKTMLYDCFKLTGVAGTDEPLKEPEPDTTKCDLSTKPVLNFDTHQVYISDCQPDLTNVCGNGILEPSEICESDLLPAADASCCVQCQWSTSAECVSKRTEVDAAMMWNDKMYLFQGDQVYRYSGSPSVLPWNSQPDTGFPRPITTNFPGLANEPNFNSNIDSALVKPDSSEMWIFNGLTALRYDLVTNARIATVNLEPASSSFFIDCGKVEASLAFRDTMWVMCGSLVQLMTYIPSMNELGFMPDFDFDLVYPDSIQKSMEAAVHYELTGESVFFNGGYTVQWLARTPKGPAERMAGLGEGGPAVVDPANPGGVNPDKPGGDAPADSCCADSCATCDCDAPSVCLTCFGLAQPVAGGFCLTDNVVTYLGFDENSANDAKHIKPGQDLSNRYVPGLAANFGDVANTGLSFNGNQKLEMIPLIDKNIAWKGTDKLRISAFFNPSPIPASDGRLPSQRFVTLKDESGIPLLTIDFAVQPRCEPPEAPVGNEVLCACKEQEDDQFDITYPDECQYGSENILPYCYVDPLCPDGIPGKDEFDNPSGFTIRLCSGSDCTAASDGPASSRQFKVEVKTPVNEFNCFVRAPLTVNQWNKIFFEFGDSEFTTGVGGLRHRRAFANVAGDAQNTFQIGDWEIGSDSGGINGVLDHFQMEIGEPGNGLANQAGIFGGANSDGGSSDAGAIAAGVLVPIFVIAIIAFICWYFWDDICAGKKSTTKGDMVSMSSGPQQPGMASNVEWYYVENGGQVGPLTDAEFQSRLGSQIKEDTLVWNGTSVQDWVPAKEVSFLKSKFEGTRGSPWAAQSWKKKAPAPQVEETLWNYVGPDGANIGPISESQLLRMNLSGETYVWNGTTVNEWTYLKNTYLAGRR